uniref:Two pore calcium channel protein 1B-like isoform X3 n=1 Tax=Nicotiana tabacum TaxID=4097 RepID=A0A1S4DRI9_TOBAC|nr:PREDICTED: two pore calcium channel protein 1B-like isoform X3 [Nicotiana tabacum]
MTVEESALLADQNKRSSGGPRFNRRSDVIASGSPYQKAAALVDLAEDGVGLPEEILEGSSFEKAAPLYFMFTDFHLVIGTFNSLALVILNFLEGVTLIILMIHILFPISYGGFHLYWKSLLNRVKVILLFILVADIVVYIVFPVNYYLPFRIAPYLRVVFFILNNRNAVRGGSLVPDVNQTDFISWTC